MPPDSLKGYETV